MKIGIAQISPKQGQIEKNITSHKKIIFLALDKGIDAIFFPELSITGYKIDLTEELKISPNDKRFEMFQKICNEKKITIGIGVPIEFEDGVKISMLIFDAENEVQTYSKQILHDDEKPYFKEGNSQLILNINGNTIAPAICYESLQTEHIDHAIEKGANIYIACVAKSQKGIDKANLYFPKVAKEKSIPILMANCVGFCDHFKSVGQSSVWNKNGDIIGQLGENKEGVLVYDSETETAYNIEKEVSQ